MISKVATGDHETITVDEFNNEEQIEKKGRHRFFISLKAAAF